MRRHVKIMISNAMLAAVLGACSNYEPSHQSDRKTLSTTSSDSQTLVRGSDSIAPQTTNSTKAADPMSFNFCEENNKLADIDQKACKGHYLMAHIDPEGQAVKIAKASIATKTTLELTKEDSEAVFGLVSEIQTCAAVGCDKVEIVNLREQIRPYLNLSVGKAMSMAAK